MSRRNRFIYPKRHGTNGEDRMRLIDLCINSVRKMNGEKPIIPANKYLEYLRRVDGTWECEVVQ